MARRGLRLVGLEHEHLQIGVLAGKDADNVEILWVPRDRRLPVAHARIASYPM